MRDATRWRVPAVLAMAATVALSLAAGGMAPAHAQSPTPAAAPQDGYRLGSQDKVRVKAFEWRPARDETFEWTALGDEYRIGASGELVLPLAGALQAGGLRTEDLAIAIGDRMKANLGLMARPDVTVEIVQFRPFYVVGPVERPGEFQYRPGLTVIQAVALAGGLSRNRDLSLARFERDAISSRGEIRSYDFEMVTLMARRARLQAELSDLPSVTYPAELKRRSGEALTRTVLQQEDTIFNARLSAFKTQNEAMLQLNEYLAKEVISLNAQVASQDKQTQLVQKELNSVTTLVEKGLSAAPRQLALERTIAQIEGDKLRLGTNLLKAQQEISRTTVTLSELRNKRVGDSSLELRVTQTRLDEVTARRGTAEQLLEEAEFSAPAIAEIRRRRIPPRYTITRGNERIEPEAVTDATALQPGDTLTVEVPLPDDLLPPARRAVMADPPTTMR